VWYNTIFIFKVIAAEGEQKASHALKQAADVMASSSAALQLRYLQTLGSISAEKNSTIIFPLPIDLLGSFMNIKSPHVCKEHTTNIYWVCFIVRIDMARQLLYPRSLTSGSWNTILLCVHVHVTIWVWVRKSSR